MGHSLRIDATVPIVPSVSLVVTSTGLDCRGIQEILGVPAFEARDAEPDSPFPFLRRTHVWSIASHASVVSSEIGVHLDWLVSALSILHPGLIRLRTSPGVTIAVSCRYPMKALDGPRLSARHLKALGDLDLSLDMIGVPLELPLRVSSSPSRIAPETNSGGHHGPVARGAGPVACGSDSREPPRGAETGPRAPIRARPIGSGKKGVGCPAPS